MDTGGLRVSDAERDTAVSELSTHFQVGRLTMDEFDERSDQALRAKTRSDLAVLFTDLPSAAPAPANPVAAKYGPAKPAPLARRSSVPIWAFVAVLAAINAITLVYSFANHQHHVVFIGPILLWLLLLRRIGRGGSRMIQPPK